MGTSKMTMKATTAIIFFFMVIYDVDGCASGPNCKELVAFERKAFALCQHSNPKGFRWQEVYDCEIKFQKAGLSLKVPTKDEFEKMDGNNNGLMTMDEWKCFTKCHDQK